MIGVFIFLNLFSNNLYLINIENYQSRKENNHSKKIKIKKKIFTFSKY